MKSGIESIEQTAICHATTDFYVVRSRRTDNANFNRRQPPKRLGDINAAIYFATTTTPQLPFN